jgi:hypothetical protein
MQFHLQQTEGERTRLEIMSKWYGVPMSRLYKDLLDKDFHATEEMRNTYETYNDLLRDNQ